MNTEKMNSLLDQIAIFSRLKKIALHQYEKKEQLREMILDIHDAQGISWSSGHSTRITDSLRSP